MGDPLQQDHQAAQQHAAEQPPSNHQVPDDASHIVYENTGVSLDGVIAPGPHRVKAISIVPKVLSTASALFVMIIVGFFTALGGGGVAATLGTMGMALIFLVGLIGATIAKYFYFTWELTDSGIRIREGMLRKKDLTIPYTKIHSMNSSAKIVQRLMGVVTLTFDTGASGGSSEGANIIDGISQLEAEALRKEVFMRKAILLERETKKYEVGLQSESAPEPGVSTYISELNEGFRGFYAGGQIVDEPIAYERVLTNKELFLTAITNASIGPLFVALAVVVGNGVEFVSTFFGDSAVFDYVASGAQAAASAATLEFAVIIFVIVLLVMIITLVVSALAEALKYGGFIIRRRSDRLEINQGVLNKKNTSIALDRIQAIVVRQSFIRKLIGYAQVEVHILQATQASQEEREAEQMGVVVVHPFIKVQEIPHFVQSAMPNQGGMGDVELEKLPAVSLRRSLVRALIWIVVVCALFIPLSLAITYGVFGETVPVGPYVAPPIALFVLILVVYRVLAWRRARIGYDDKRLVLVTGSLGMVTSMIQRSKIQDATMARTIFQVRAKVATYRAVTASDHYSMRDVREQTADDLLNWIRSRQDNSALAQAALHEAGLLQTNSED